MCFLDDKTVTQSHFFFFLMLVVFVYLDVLMNGQWRSNLTHFSEFLLFDLFPKVSDKIPKPKFALWNAIFEATP